MVFFTVHHLTLTSGDPRNGTLQMLCDTVFHKELIVEMTLQKPCHQGRRLSSSLLWDRAGCHLLRKMRRRQRLELCRGLEKQKWLLIFLIQMTKRPKSSPLQLAKKMLCIRSRKKRVSAWGKTADLLLKKDSKTPKRPKEEREMSVSRRKRRKWKKSDRYQKICWPPLSNTFISFLYGSEEETEEILQEEKQVETPVEKKKKKKSQWTKG